MEGLIVKVDGKEYKVNVEESDEGKIRVFFDGKVYEVETKANVEQIVDEEIEKKSIKKEGEFVIRAPLPGTVASIDIKKDDNVDSGDLLLKLVAMKMENEIIAPKSGRIKEIKVKKNDNVNKGDVLIVIE